MKIKYQLALILIGISILVAGIISIIFFVKVKNTLINHTYDQLEAICETKRIRLEDMIKNKYELVEILVDNERLKNNLQVYINESSNKHRTGIYNLIQFYNEKIKTVNEVSILNTYGVVIISTDSTLIGRNLVDSTNFKEKHLKKSTIGAFFYDNQGRYNLFVSTPILWNGNPIGVLFAHQPAADIISLTKEYTGLGETGETIIADKDGDVRYLAPVRFNHSNPQISNAIVDQVGHIAINRKTGIFQGYKDYRGVEVIASVRSIPETGWAIITKMDKSEVMNPLIKLRNILISINAAVIFLTIIIANYAGNFLGHPIEELAEKVKQVKEGHYNQRLVVKEKNEIGQLKKGYNQMAETLEKKIRLLHASNESLNKFAYIISHDLKSPLASIEALSSMLEIEYNNKPLDENGKTMLSMIRAKSKQMEELITEVLSTAKTGSSSNLTKERLNLDVLLQQIISNLNVPKHIEVAIASPLPQVYYHKISMIQVLQNIIGNAIKYNDKPNGVITISCELFGSKVKFCIKDNGPGIKPEDYKNIFHLFSKGAGSEHRDSFGIGLSIVKKIVTENNGEVWVESNPGEGTTFCFTVPAENS